MNEQTVDSVITKDLSLICGEFHNRYQQAINLIKFVFITVKNRTKINLEDIYIYINLFVLRS